jgi:hypothetical protein
MSGHRTIGLVVVSILGLLATCAEGRPLAQNERDAIDGSVQAIVDATGHRLGCTRVGA